jgi:peptidoglycan/xylan/chitin deacetylase (PgdA/CDA1 family)
MSRRTTTLVKAALSALHYTGADGMMAPLADARAVILMLHQVNPELPRAFEPNRILRVTPQFLDRTLTQVRERGFRFVTMSELADHLDAGLASAPQPLVAVTLDDGYRDNLVHALPVFQRHGVPFTVYVPTDFADGTGDLWWLTLEHAIAVLDVADLEIDGTIHGYDLIGAKAKTAAYHDLYWRLRRIDETVARQLVSTLARRAGIDPSATCRALMLDWSDIATLAADPLVTIGAHTRRHFALARLGAGAARVEIAEGASRLAAELRRPIHHLSYPFGDAASAGPREFELARQLGFRTAVTTRKGLIPASANIDLLALPRLSLNGDYQDPRYTKVLLSGVPFLLRDAAKRVVGAG